MRIEVQSLDFSGDPTEARIIHGGSIVNGEQVGGEILEWNIALFDKMSIGNFDIFAEINAYWSRQPVAAQDNIFSIYKHIRELFDNVYDNDQLAMLLSNSVAELYNFHEMEAMNHWVKFYSNIRAPDSVQGAFIDVNDGAKTRERTYLKDDYMGLVALSISLRIMIPIWGEFILRTKKEAGTLLKEFFAIRLLNRTNVVHSEPMERLRVYVENSIPADKSKAAAILTGISTEDFAGYILALVVIRRLTIGPVTNHEPNTNLVTFIHKYIRQKAQQDQNFQIVKDKVNESQSTDSENNLSRLEGYKIKQDISDGEIEILAYYIKNPYKAAAKICPDLPQALLELSLTTVSELMHVRLQDPQITLVQWVMKPAIQPRGILHLSKPAVLIAIAITQAVLWHRNYRDLAVMVSAIALPNADVMRLEVEARHRISQQQLEELDVLFPHARKTSNKMKVGKRVNPGVESIELLAAAFGQHTWRLTAPQEWVQEVNGNKGNRVFAIRRDVKNRLADLVIQIASRKF